MSGVFERARLICSRPILPFLVGLFLAFSGCATFTPKPASEVPFLERVQTQQKGQVRVSVVVLSAEESRQVFGVPLEEKGVQAVWLGIENGGKSAVWFIPWSCPGSMDC